MSKSSPNTPHLDIARQSKGINEQKWQRLKYIGGSCWGSITALGNRILVRTFWLKRNYHTLFFKMFHHWLERKVLLTWSRNLFSETTLVPWDVLYYKSHWAPSIVNRRQRPCSSLWLVPWREITPPCLFGQFAKASGGSASSPPCLPSIRNGAAEAVKSSPDEHWRPFR